MEPGFPTVPPIAPIDTIVHLLHHNHAVIVVEQGKVQGVITKHDLISLIT
jgi:predicted transcriptional regulator